MIESFPDIDRHIQYWCNAARGEGLPLADRAFNMEAAFNAAHNAWWAAKEEIVRLTRLVSVSTSGGSMAYIDLQAARKTAAEFNERWVADGGQLTKYTCGCCKNVINIRRPGADDVGSKGYWDGLTMCVHCGTLQLLLVYPTGVVEAFNLKGQPVTP